MKIDRRNPKHWLYLSKSGIYTLLCIPFRYFLKRKSARPLVILYGHKLNGNLLALYRYCQVNPQPWDIRFLTLDPDYAREHPDIEPLLSIRFRDMLQVVTADCIVTDHGLHALFPLLYATNIRFVDVWHGVPFKGFVPASFRVQHRYDQIWVSSPAMRDLYLEQFGFDAKQVFVTGYGRTDTLIHYYSQRHRIRARFAIPKARRVILFAPTWAHEDAQRSESPFGHSLEAFADRLQTFARTHNAVVLVRQHLNSTNGRASDSADYVRIVSAANYPDAEEILAISDCLLTDWSSIAFDFMAIRKPIVFLDVPAPFKHGFALPPDCRAGAIVRNFDEVEVALERALCGGAGCLTVDESEYDRVRNIAFGDTLDGRSSQRYAERLERLLSAA